MRNLKYLVLFCFGLIGNDAAFGTVYCGAGQVCDADIYITDTTVFENYGTITGNININCATCAVSFQNYGTVSGNINISDGANPALGQVISGNDNAHRIDNLVGHTVFVENAININMAAVVDAAANATSVQLSDVSVVIEPGIPNYGVPIVVYNNVSFIIVGANDDDDIPLLENVVGTPALQVSGIDSMFAPSVQLTNSNLYLHMIRAVNYGSVIGGDVGNFLDSVRARNADDKLIVALDAAPNRDALRAIMNESVRTNPIMLGRPMRTVVAFNDLSAFADADDGLSVGPFYVMSRDFDAFGGAVGVGGIIAKHLVADVSAFGVMMDYDGKYDEFSGAIYGGRVGLTYSDDDLWLGMRGIYAMGAFNDLVVFDGMNDVENPHAKLADFVADIGPVFKFTDDMRLTPFIGGRMNWTGVVGVSETNTLGRLGIETLFDTNTDGNRYSVGLRAVIHTDGAVYGALRTGVVSDADCISVALECGVVNDDMGWSVRFGLNAKLLF